MNFDVYTKAHTSIGPLVKESAAAAAAQAPAGAPASTDNQNNANDASQ
jgi:hypothetical protein